MQTIFQFGVSGRHFQHVMMVGIVWPGIIGEVEAREDGKSDYYLWTHKKLDIGYNGDMVSERECGGH